MGGVSVRIGECVCVRACMCACVRVREMISADVLTNSRCRKGAT